MKVGNLMPILDISPTWDEYYSFSITHLRTAKVEFLAVFDGLAGVRVGIGHFVEAFATHCSPSVGGGI